MITKIQFQKDTAVLAEDGKKVGALERVVINPATNAITDVVIRIGSFFNQKEKVVPVEMVAETTDGRILLHEDAGDLEEFPPFEEERIVNERGILDKPSSSEGGLPPLAIGYPVIAAPTAQAAGERIVTRKEYNIREGTVALKKSADVLSSDDKNVGKVESVLAEPLENEITYFAVSSGLLEKESKLIPIEWVMRVGEDAIHLRVEKSAVDSLVEEPVAG